MRMSLWCWPRMVVLATVPLPPPPELASMNTPGVNLARSLVSVRLRACSSSALKLVTATGTSCRVSCRLRAVTTTSSRVKPWPKLGLARPKPLVRMATDKAALVWGRYGFMRLLSGFIVGLPSYDTPQSPGGPRWAKVKVSNYTQVRFKGYRAVVAVAEGRGFHQHRRQGFTGAGAGNLCPRPQSVAPI